MELRFVAILVSVTSFIFFDAYLCIVATPIYSSRLIHGFLDEAKQWWMSKGMSNGKSNTQEAWPEKKSLDHMRLLLGGDLKWKRLRLGTQNQLLVPSQGIKTYNYGNDLGCKPSTVEEVLAIHIKLGWKKGTKITFPEKGNHEASAILEDLTFVVDEKLHPIFKIDGNDVIRNQKNDALTGMTINLTTLDGRNLSIQVLDIVKQGHGMLIQNEGIPISK